MLKKDNLEIILLRSKYLKQKDYWMKKLSGELEPTDILPVHDRKQTASPDPGRMEIPFPQELSKRISNISKNSEISIYILLLSALNSLIYRYTANEDIVLLSPVSKLKINRETFNNCLFIRQQAVGELTFRELVINLRQSMLEAYENQDYPSDKLVEYLFPSWKEENQPVISHILCSMENLHHRKDIEKIKAGFCFHFSKTADLLEGYILYEPNTCKKNEAFQISNHFSRLLAKAIEDVDVKIPGILFLTAQEKKQLLVDFNSNKVDFYRNKTLSHWIEEQVKQTPDAAAIGFREYGITYRELNKRANQQAKTLQNRGIKNDQPVGILLERSPQMVESILGVWKSGGAYIPLDIEDPIQRLIGILQDSAAGIILTRQEYILPQLETSYNGVIIRLDQQAEEPCPDRTGHFNLNINTHCLAYVIYTSGSTGKPKGVMVEHIGMMNHIQAKIRDLQITGRSIIAQNSIHTFDISVWQFFAALTQGGKSIIYPDELVFDPDRLISRIIKNQVTLLEVVPSYLQVMLEFLDTNSRSFQVLEYLLVTGETITPLLVKRWFRLFPDIKMVNAFGPTEASDDITHLVMDKPVEGDRIPIGKPLPNFNIYIIDKNLEICPLGVIGEIWVSGVGVGRGYLNNVEKTNRVFTTDPFAEAKGTPLFITGDLGRWLTDGTIEFFGRKDYQVKIRGLRVELGEIENQLAAYPGIKEAVVMIKKTAKQDKQAGDESLCAYLVTKTNEKPDAAKMKAYLSERLPDYMLPAYFVVLERIPLTPNGKIDRKALPQPQRDALQYTPPASKAEEKLVEIWSELLGIDKNRLGVQTGFFEAGGHSLMAVLLLSRIHKVFNVKLSLGEVFARQTIRDLAQCIDEVLETRYIPINPLEKKEYYPLSSAQKRLYVIQQAEKTGMAYNVTQIHILEGQLHGQRLEKAARELIQRHESLRTSIEIPGNNPVQRIHQEVGFALQYHKGKENETKKTVENFIQPFDLNKAPCFRLGLINMGETKNILIIDMHHIITDGISNDIFINEFVLLYKGKELQSLRLQYKDFSQWQNKWLESEEMKRQENYWLKLFQGEVPVLELPTDYERPLQKSFAGARLTVALGADETAALKEYALNRDVTLFMLLLTVFYVLLAKISGQEDIVVGTAVSGRRHVDLESVVGMFINSLALRNYPASHKTFETFLMEVKETTIKAFDNQDYPLEELVRRLSKDRDRSRNPLFDVILALENLRMLPDRNREHEMKTPGINIKPYTYEKINSKLDMTFTVIEGENNLYISVVYCTALFKETTMQRIVNYYKNIIGEIPGIGDKKLSGIEIRSEVEKKITAAKISDETKKKQHNTGNLAAEFDL